jgi:hypothetical protein
VRLADNEGCVSLRNQLYDNEDFTDIETARLNVLVGHLREYSHQCALGEDYSEAKRAQILCEHTKEELARRATCPPHLTELHETAAQRRQDFEATWSQNRQNYDKETDRKRSELFERQAHERRVFDRVWNEDKPHWYRKPSARLLQFKKIEQSLAITGQIDQASAVHDRADEISQAEMVAAQAVLDNDYQQSYERLLDQQQQARELFERRREHGRQLLESEYRRLDSYVTNRESVVQLRTLRQKPRRDECAVSPATIRNPTERGGTLLPPLTPPNDRRYVQQKKTQRADRARIQEDYQRRNAEAILSQFRWEPPPEEQPKTEELSYTMDDVAVQLVVPLDTNTTEQQPTEPPGDAIAGTVDGALADVADAIDGDEKHEDGPSDAVDEAAANESQKQSCEEALLAPADEEAPVAPDAEAAPLGDAVVEGQPQGEEGGTFGDAVGDSIGTVVEDAG